MMEVFAAIERTPPSVWMREDLYAYFYVLIFHALGMALFVGGAGVICLRAAGFMKGAPLEKFGGFLPVVWLGLIFAVASGLGLLVAYPAKALTNPIFAMKFLALGAAGWLVWRIVKTAFPAAAAQAPLPRWTPRFAVAAIACLVGVIAAGKLLLYTYTVLTVA
jgi:hypothetical protein